MKYTRSRCIFIELKESSALLATLLDLLIPLVYLFSSGWVPEIIALFGCQCRCSIYQYGDLTRATKALDGIFGFGQGEFSVISQLSSRGITPKVFSHCLKGGENGGGILVLGEILEPSIVYSPLIPSQYVFYLVKDLVIGPSFLNDIHEILDPYFPPPQNIS